MIAFWLLLSFGFSVNGFIIAHLGRTIVHLLPVLGSIAPLFGPLIYLHFRTNSELPRSRKSTVAHFLLAAIMTLLYLPLHFYESEKKLIIFNFIYRLQDVLSGEPTHVAGLSHLEILYASSLPILMSISDSTISIYLFTLMKKRYFKIKTGSLFLYDLLSIVGILVGLTFVLGKYSLELFNSIIPLALTLFNLAIIFLFEESYKDLHIFFKNRAMDKARRSYLGGIDSHDLKKKIEHSIKVEKLYLVEDITLHSYASHLGITSHQLSEFLNKEMQIGFKKFINRYRIREACEIMKRDREKNLLDIALACGFNSRSAFNRVFMEEMNVSPIECRRRLDENADGTKKDPSTEKRIR